MKKLFMALILSVLVVFSSAAQNQRSIDLVLLLDVSASMSGSYREVSEYISGPFLREFLRIGDTFHLISFSDTPKIEISRRIEGRGDLETIIGRLFLMYPLEAYSDIEGALNYAERYVSFLPETRPKKVVIITDGDQSSRQPSASRAGVSPGALDARVAETAARLSKAGADLRLVRIPLEGGGPSSGREPLPSARGRTAPPAPAASPARPPAPASPAAPPPAASPPAVTPPTRPPTPAATSPAASSPAAIPPARPPTPASPAAPPPAASPPAAIPPTRPPTPAATSPAASSPAAIPPARPPAPAATSPAASPPAATPAPPAVPPVDRTAVPPSAVSPSVTVPPTVSSPAAEPEAPLPVASRPAPEPSSGGGVLPAGEAGPARTAPAAIAPPPEPSPPAADGERAGFALPFSFSFPLLLGLGILLLLIAALIVFLIARRLHGSPTKAMAYAMGRSVPHKEEERLPRRPPEDRQNAELLASYAAKQRKGSRISGAKPIVSERVEPPKTIGENLMISLFVEDQNTAIGRRNIHNLKAGNTYTIGGGASDYLIFLVPMPPRIAEIHYDGRQCTFIPRRPEFFPDIGSRPVPDCIGKTIRVISGKNYELFIRLEWYEDPIASLNRLLNSVNLPG